MRYSINNYVGAFTEVIKKVPHDKAVDGFLKLLVKTGDIKHANKILEAIHKKITAQNGGKWVDIEVARQTAESKLKSLKSKFTAKDHIEVKINPELVAGTRVTIDGQEELNNTLQNKLNKLFR